MADQNPSDSARSKRLTQRSDLPADGKEASQQLVSLSQVVLGPLDALMKAQVHAARSFLNFVLQTGFPDQPSPIPQPPREGGIVPDGEATQVGLQNFPAHSHDPHLQTFHFEQTDATGQSHKTSLQVPTLALMPITPLAIESATFDLELSIKQVAPHQQLKQSDSGKASPKSPWFLVPDPISIQGTLSDEGGKDAPGKPATVKIHVQVAKAPLPAGLTKLIGTISQMAEHKAQD